MKEAPRPQPTLIKERGIHNPFAKGGVVRIALAPLLATGGISGGILNSACAPAAPSLEYQSNIPIVGDPSKAAEHGDTIVASPTPDQRLGLATGSATSGSEQTSARTDSGATTKPAETPISPSEIPAQLDSILASVDAMPASLNPRIGQEFFDQSKGGISSELQKIKELLASGDVEEARKIIYRTRQVDKAIEVSGMIGTIINLGDPLQEKFISPAIKQKHDPKGKYIRKGESLDPRIMDLYLGVIDILVATDPSY